MEIASPLAGVLGEGTVDSLGLRKRWHWKPHLLSNSKGTKFRRDQKQLQTTYLYTECASCIYTNSAGG